MVCEVDHTNVVIHVYSYKKATDAQLEEYGFQPRPTDVKALAEWEDIMSHYKRTPVPKTIHVRKKGTYKSKEKMTSNNSMAYVPETAALLSTEASEIWSGYALKGNAGQYRGAQGKFTQPTLLSGSPTDSELASWVGMDIENNPYLIQAGTHAKMSDNSCNPVYAYGTRYQPPYEVIIETQTVHPNDIIHALTGYTMNGKIMLFSLDNMTTGNYWQTVVEIPDDEVPSQLPNRALWIDERPTYSITDHSTEPPTITQWHTPLANYGVINWYDCYANNQNWNLFGLGSGNYEEFIMTSDDGQRILSDPNPLSTITSFTDVWVNSD